MRKLVLFLLLHICILFYSISGIFSKIASNYPVFSVGFLCCYGAILMILVLYAIFWQQILKKMPLTVAYANKAMTVVWGIVWGILLFHEKISVKGMIGALFIIAGICMLAFEEREK